MKNLKNIISVLIIQSFLAVNCAGADNYTLFEKSHLSTLSPQIHINANQFQKLFIVHLKARTAFLKAASHKMPEKHKTAYDLTSGYKKFNSLVNVMKRFRKEALIISVEGDVSTGKTTFLNNYILKYGIGGISADKILFIDKDEIINDLMEEEGLSFISAFAELPFILEQKIALHDNAALIIVQGSDNLSFLEDAGYSADLVLVLEAANMTKFKRHLMRNGLFLGVKFFFEDRSKPYISKNAHLLTITNETHIPILEFFAQTSIATLTKSLEYIMPAFIIEIFQEKTLPLKNGIKNLLQKKIIDVRGEIDILELIFLPLKMFSYMLNKFSHTINKRYDAYKNNTLEKVNNLNNRPASIYDFQESLEKIKGTILKLIDAHELFDAVIKFKQIKGRNIDLGDIQPKLISALKLEGDHFFILEDYDRAIKYYQKILEVTPEETSINFYIGAAYFLNQEIVMSGVYFSKTKGLEHDDSPVFNQVNLMFEAVTLSQEIPRLYQINDIELKVIVDSIKQKSIERLSHILEDIYVIQKKHDKQIEAFADRGGGDSLIFYYLFTEFSQKFTEFEKSFLKKDRIFLNKKSTFAYSKFTKIIKRKAKGQLIKFKLKKDTLRDVTDITQPIVKSSGNFAQKFINQAI